MPATLKETLSGSGCENVEETLERFLNDEDFYRQLVRQTLEDAGFERLGAELKQKRTGDAFATAHMLKGVLANCGLTPMSRTVSRIVEPLRGGSTEDLSAPYAELLSQRRQFLQLLSKI